MTCNILVTGANGFIGSKLVESLAARYNVWSMVRSPVHDMRKDCSFLVDICDASSVCEVCRLVKPDVVIHCAGIAHQRVGRISRDEYFNVNAEATAFLARNAAAVNPDVFFIHLSSVSVYGEMYRSRYMPLDEAAFIKEDDVCLPVGPYAESKYEGERLLTDLYNCGILRGLAVLRLAPVYDSGWTLNLNRRILAPCGLAYLRFGSGYQRMSALARPNLVEIIETFVAQIERSMLPDYSLMNVCDADTYSFNRLIDVFERSGLTPKRLILPVSLRQVDLLTKGAACIDHDRADWWRACYAKLAGDQVFDNRRMLETGFVPRHSLESVLGSCFPVTGHVV